MSTTIKRPRGKNLNLVNPEDLIITDKEDIKFKDISGHNDIKEILKDFSFSLKDSDAYMDKFAVETRKGILLHGPSGCGKTLLIKALCYNSTGVFYNVKITDLFSRWFSETEKSLHLILEHAKETAESESGNCIVFFDEFDEIFNPKFSSPDSLSLRLTGVLREHINDNDSRIHLVACSNDIRCIPYHVINSVFDTILMIDFPNKNETKEYLKNRCEYLNEKNQYASNLLTLDYDKIADYVESSKLKISYRNFKLILNEILRRKAIEWRQSSDTIYTRNKNIKSVTTQDVIDEISLFFKK